ncbi:MAG: hypothetical protein IMF26_02835 [Candidatus Fermentithermobacillus carboniphilus]|uniref:Uncharacterized protein n=1 Tax=Candidatus Fermentithermobacillus carboniphilus TaxID=3085328 RepID=A0AAT9LCW8_9FIRM|nr:MAG: hypothetical protein IMF26_02835 [Candidatus Fermentithermobacillus carboniphilus]
MLEKLQRIDSRIIFLILALAIMIPLFRPIGMPISINKDLTQKFYDVIESLPEGSVVWFGCEYSPGASGELNPQVAAVFRHAMSKNLRVILFGMWENGTTLAREVVDPIAKEMGKKYGVDYVNLGYKPGLTAVLRAMLKDLWAAAAGVDINGTPLENLPLMADVKVVSPDTIKAVVVFSSGSPGDPDYLTYWTDPYGMILLTGQVAVQVPSRMPYMQSGQHKGLIPGLRGAAEYEKLIGKPGIATQLMDAQSTAHLTIIIFVILGNIAFFAQKLSKGGKSK